MRRLAILLWSVLLLLLIPRAALAAGSFKLKSTEVQEVSGGWHIYCSLELPKAPPIAHQTMRFVFTPTVVYERSLIDGHNDPVLNRQVVTGQTPSTESLDVDFADPRGQIWKGTRFDFSLTRTKGYQAGEYDVKVRSSDGTDIGTVARLTLKGDNPVVDRRAIAFNAKDTGIKKVPTGLDGGAVAKNTAGNDDPGPSPTATEVAPSGSSTPFVSADAYNKTPEEEVKERPKGCGCSTPGSTGGDMVWLAIGGLLALAVVIGRRLR